MALLGLGHNQASLIGIGAIQPGAGAKTEDLTIPDMGATPAPLNTPANNSPLHHMAGLAIMLVALFFIVKLFNRYG